MTYKIELAQQKYISELAEISRTAAELFPVEDLPLALRAETTAIEIFEQALNEQRLWVAIDQSTSKAIGFAYLIKQCGQIHLRELDVHPQHGRQGVGTALLRKVIRWAKDQNYNQMTLTTFRHLHWNAPFYSKHGFRIIEPPELSSCLNKLFEEEAKGLDKSKRVLMRLNLADEQ